MAVLVTGASGFVGGRLAEALTRRGEAVRAVARGTRPVRHGPGMAWVLGNILDGTSLESAMDGVHRVYHVAAVVPGRGGTRDMWETNVAGTRTVAEACRRCGVGRLVLLSSVAVYRSPLPDRVHESAPTGGMDDYGRSKSAAEAEAREGCRGEVDLVIIRPCQVFGFGDGTSYTRRLLDLLASPILPLAGGSGRPYSLIHVSDLVQALIEAGRREGLGGKVFNIAPRAGITLSDLVRAQDLLRAGPRFQLRLPVPERLAQAALALRWAMKTGWRGNPATLVAAYLAHAAHGSLILGGPLYDVSAAEASLGFHPAMSFETALGELLAKP